MRRSRRWITALGLPFAAVAAVAFQPLALAGPPTNTVTARPAPTVTPKDDRDVEQLLQRLTALSELIARDPQSAQGWRLQIEQADVLEKLAARSTGAEQDNFLRMVVDSLCSAAALSPVGETEARLRLAQLPARIASGFPGSPMAAYAALQIVRADYLQRISESPAESVTAQRRLCEGLMAVAATYPRSPEAPGVVLEAAQTYEKLGRTDDACRCYRFLAEHFRGQAAARKAVGALWRLAGPGTPVQLDQPFLYSTGDSTEAALPPQSLRGKVVVAYFWSSKAPQAAADLHTLRELSDRYQDRGLEVVSVNVDGDPQQARAFLAGQLTAGVQLYQPGGSDGAAERYGIMTLPAAILIAPDGKLARHSMQASQVESEVVNRLHTDR